MNTKQLGMAMLETAAILTALMAFGIAAVGVVSYLQELSVVQRVVDESIIADNIKPFLVSASGIEDTSLQLNQTGLTKFLDASMNKLKDGLGADSKIRIELQYAVININPATGRYLGVDSSGAASRVFGSMTEKSENCPALAALIGASASKTDDEGRSIHATPSAAVFDGESAKKYFPRSVLVAVRVLKDLRSSPGGVLYSAISDMPLATNCKTISLRGEVEDGYGI